MFFSNNDNLHDEIKKLKSDNEKLAKENESFQNEIEELTSLKNQNSTVQVINDLIKNLTTGGCQPSCPS
jgi:hypothetical protein